MNLILLGLLCLLGHDILFQDFKNVVNLPR